MRNLLSFIVCSLLISSCTPITYHQIATLSSNSVFVDDNGRFLSEPLKDISIEYDFWGTSGKVIFTITNNSNEDIYLDLQKSFYINNGYAYDMTVLTNVELDNKDVISHIMWSANNPMVCIPANSRRAFGGFNVTPTVYRECGFVRNPGYNEDAILRFSVTDSPIILENRLTFVINETSIPVNHLFYLSEIVNIAQNIVIKNESYRLNCKGINVYSPHTIYWMKASNRFYIPYSITNGDDDRVK